jgi:hypothetical protein
MMGPAGDLSLLRPCLDGGAAPQLPGSAGALRQGEGAAQHSTTALRCTVCWLLFAWVQDVVLFGAPGQTKGVMHVHSGWSSSGSHHIHTSTGGCRLCKLCCAAALSAGCLQVRAWGGGAGSTCCRPCTCARQSGDLAPAHISIPHYGSYVGPYVGCMGSAATT